MKTSKLRSYRKYGQLFEGIFSKNVVLVYGLSLTCIAVAANNVRNALVLSIAMTFILIPVMVAASLLPRNLDDAWRVVIVSTISIGAVYAAYFIIGRFDLSVFATLGIYFPLLTFSSGTLVKANQHMGSKKPFIALLDAIISSAGYFTAAFLVGTVREILASGTFMGNEVSWWTMKMPAFRMTFGGFIIMAFIAAGIKTLDRGIRSVIYHRDNAKRKESV